MKLTTRGRPSTNSEVLERRTASTQHNVYYVKVEAEESWGRPYNERIEIVHGDVTYRLELDEAGLVLSGHVEDGLPVTGMNVDSPSANTIIIRGLQEPDA